MSTTTIRLPDDLKARVAAAAEREGKSPHGFILEAIAEKAEDAERRSAFHAEAEQRYAGLVERGEAIRWTDMRAYLEARAAGRTARRPAARKLGR